MTLREALRRGIKELEQHQVPDARPSAEVLLAHCLSVDRTFLYTHDERLLTEDEILNFDNALLRRKSRVPVQYIAGRQEFFGRNFGVNPAVLIPRPETEAIVESVLALNSARHPRILDVGTGSGCIAITLGLEIPGSQVFAIDISLEAIRVAEKNALQLGARVHFACMDLTGALARAASGFDFIVSNPPYVSRSHMDTLQPEVIENEPHSALFASEDGLAIIRKLVPDAERLLVPGGYLILEIGIGMGDRVKGLFGPLWEEPRIQPDLQGIPRCVMARLSGH